MSNIFVLKYMLFKIYLMCQIQVWSIHNHNSLKNFLDKCNYNSHPKSSDNQNSYCRKNIGSFQILNKLLSRYYIYITYILEIILSFLSDDTVFPCENTPGL